MLPIAESLRFRWSQMKSRTQLPACAYDAYGHLDWEMYLIAGLPIARYIADVVRSGGRQQSVLEWGCGPAGVIRHMHDLLPSSELVGIDYNAESIEWCRSHVPGVAFSTNNLMPPTRFADATFDCIYSVSVFTHLSRAAHLAWADEHHRLLKPGGLMLCTLNGEATTAWLLDHERERYLAGELIVRGNVLEGSRCFLAYHPAPFVQSLLNKFTIVRHDPAPNALSLIQDVWVARKS